MGQNMVRWGDQVACGIPSSDAVMCALVTALWGSFPPCTNLSSRDNFVPPSSRLPDGRWATGHELVGVEGDARRSPPKIHAPYALDEEE